MAGYLVIMGALIGFATLQPGQLASALAFGGLFGIGLSIPLVLVIAGVQLAIPHQLIATASAVIISSRSVGGTIGTAIYSAAINPRLASKIPNYVAKAALSNGLPRSSLPSFIQNISSANEDALAQIPGVTPTIVNAGLKALKHAFADSVRITFEIAAPVAVIGLILAFFFGSLSRTMNSHVDAPVENLHQREHGSHRDDTEEAVAVRFEGEK